MLPERFLKRIANQNSLDPIRLAEALEKPSPVSIRINESKWKSKPVVSEQVPWCHNGFYLSSRPSYTLDPLFHSGCYYPQEASGMFMEEVVRQIVVNPENIRALDLCGAPGGKSIHISDMLGNGSFLISNEVIRSRASVLSETITKWGSANTIVTQNDPSSFSRLPGYFDLMLVDAPCSGEGMFRNRVAVDEWSEENTIHCTERQKRILMDVWPALKENGILIYSTCTFNPAENEENIKWLLEKNEAECLRLDISAFNGITEIDFEGIYGYGFYPDKIKGEGLFIAAIRKTGKQERIYIKGQKKPDLRPSKDDIGMTERITGFPKERLLRWNEELFSVPCSADEYKLLFQNLKIVKGGTSIFLVKNNDYLPSHELALSVKLNTSSFPKEELSLSESLRYLKRDSISINNASKGWVIVTYKNVNLGFVKNMGNRVNNYFPVEWRIRMNLPTPGDENLIDWF